MKALILAAGLGTRLRPITLKIPKCLVSIQGKPLLRHWLDILDHQSIDGIFINTHYLADQVHDALTRDGMQNRVSLLHEQDLLGTGGTLLKHRSSFMPGPVMVIHGDNLSLFDLEKFIRAHDQRPRHCVMTMMTFRTDSPSSCGIVELDPQGVVTAFHEKTASPPGNLANGAVYIMEPPVFDIMASLNREFIDLSLDVLPRLLGRIFTFENTVYHRDIGTPESLETARREFEKLGESDGKA
ncbi:MAG: nucleotidyltransferase family protein [Desulfobacterales bacterium]|nr:nucleotidyltransferase family protein [Desulfobacterales bacterium]